MLVNAKQAKEAIIDIISARLVPNLTGSPGIGKSHIFHQIAKDFELKLIDFRLAQADPTDLLGFPTINETTGKSKYCPPEDFPLEGEAKPDGYKGWLLLFDEMNSATLAVQSAAYKVILDRMIGQRKLHNELAIACAGNLETDRAVVNRLSTAMQSRLVHLTLDVDMNTWLEWALKKKIDHRVLSFIQFRPDLLHKFSPNHSDNTFPCPRTWEFVSKLIKNHADISNKQAVLEGTIGEGPGLEFVQYTKIYKKLPTIQQLLSNPDSVTIPNDPGVIYALSGMITANIDKSTVDVLMQTVNKLPTEFQVITLQNAIVMDTSLCSVPSVRKWTAANAKELI